MKELGLNVSFINKQLSTPDKDYISTQKKLSHKIIYIKNIKNKPHPVVNEKSKNKIY